jgi:hypothetical protein
VNIALWVVQVLLALHTLMGAVWKLSNSEQTVASLKAIPHGLWLALGAFEVLCAVGLILPALNKRFTNLAPIAAVCIAGEMLLFCVLHLMSGETNHGEMIYWLAVALVCAFVAYGRFVRKPA